MAPVSFDLPPRSPWSSTSHLPKCKALLIGINYTCPPEDLGDRGPLRPLKGPVNDVKAFKDTLIEAYEYLDQDIFMMTDEEDNKDTPQWPSQANILQAIDNFVRGALPGDSFVFFYAGHSGQQEAIDDPNEDDGLDEYILACDNEIVLDNTLRARLVDRLPVGSRLIAILDACHSGTLLDLNHYKCHCFLNKRRETFVDLERKKSAPHSRKLPRRSHSEAEVPFRRVRQLSVSQLPRVTLQRAAMVTRAVVRMKFLTTNTPTDTEEEASPVLSPRPPCGSLYCAYAREKGPLVICLSACSDAERTWEDSSRKGKGMTVKLIKILRKNPSIKLGDLNQQLKKSLYKLAFKRVRKAWSSFNRFTRERPPEQRMQLEIRYKAILQFTPQTAQFGSLQPLDMDEQFLSNGLVCLGPPLACVAFRNVNGKTLKFLFSHLGRDSNTPPIARSLDRRGC
ncbi:caspase domain-containing protein [Lactifluus volemus]|nr:caspase domain-containing protein [Lactifluus volemus]